MHSVVHLLQHDLTPTCFGTRCHSQIVVTTNVRNQQANINCYIGLYTFV